MYRNSNDDFISDYSERDLKESTYGEAIKITDSVMSELFDTVVHAIYSGNSDMSYLNNIESEDN
jgi:hypothetical protein